jgi:hypothetical protein
MSLIFTRHWEERSDEAIQSSARPPLDCFASLAMTKFLGEPVGAAIT